LLAPPGGVVVAYLVVIAMGGALYVAMSMSTRSTPSSSTAMAMRRPGWIAQRRARGGIAHRRDRVGVGYKSAVGALHLSLANWPDTAPSSGDPAQAKTTLLQLLVEAAAGQQPVVIVDPKGSPALAETVRAHGGQVWTLDGRLPADLLDPRPWQVPTCCSRRKTTARKPERTVTPPTSAPCGPPGPWR